MPLIKTPIRFLEAVFLDLLFIPRGLMGKRENALWHLNFICPLCSNWRKSFRNPERKDKCLGYEALKNDKFGFSRMFGIKNVIRYYLGMKTDLEKYQKEFKQLCS